MRRPQAANAATRDSNRKVNRDRSNARGDATRQLILSTAEELFAERGIAAVPLRDIGIAAGQKNNVAVQYHFKDRDGLIREILAQRIAASEKIRVEMLADILASGEPPDVSDVVRTFVLPLAVHLEKGNHYLGFLSRYIIEHGGHAGLASFGPGRGLAAESLKAMLFRLLPTVDSKVLEERWLTTQTCAVHTLARYHVNMLAGQLPAPLDELLEDLVTFLTAGTMAPVSTVGAPRDS